MGDLDKEKMNMDSFLSASYNNYELDGEKVYNHSNPYK
jgi:hypothetical protein